MYWGGEPVLVAMNVLWGHIDPDALIERMVPSEPLVGLLVGLLVGQW